MPETKLRWSWGVLVVYVFILALAPWWRNHHYLRSFFDYGVVIGGVGRIAAGQRPYVDFISPIQTGWYVLNGLADKAGGGTYQAMTLSGAASILVSLTVLLAMLARRWPLPWAAVVAGVIVAATASQHTILWYNSWGVVLLTVVAWAGALAPVLRWPDRGWHVLAGAALFFGGINKINMQLMALGLGFAWAVRAGLTGRAGWGRVAATLAFYLGCAALAMGAELVWTGASFAAWWHDVIALPAAGRSGMLFAVIHPDFLIKILHDYYGPQALPQGALVGLLATVATVTAILRKTWREAGWVEKILPVGCGAVACLGGVVLLTTNMDISYIGVAGWLALLVALWLGYGLPARGPWFYGALIGPLLLVGAAAWTSAWQGQRSQFGFSYAARDDYVDGAKAGPEFGYLRGTRLPPELVESLGAVAAWRGSLSEDQRRRLYAGPGTEWATRLWPVWRVTGLPNYIQVGSSFGAAEESRLLQLAQSRRMGEMMISPVQDLWSGLMRDVLHQSYEQQPLGKVFAAYTRIPVPGVTIAPIWFTRTFGGNVDARYLVSDASVLPFGEWRRFLGFTEGHGEMRLTIPSNRLEGEVVVRRTNGMPKIEAEVKFVISAQGPGTARYLRWSQQVKLPADQDQVVVPYAIDSSHLPTTFEVEIPPQLSGQIAAGWRNPHISYTGYAVSDEPDWLLRSKEAVTVLDEPALAALLPKDWRPDRAVMRGGRVTDHGLELSPGGEIWLKVHGMMKELSGSAQAVAPLASAGDAGQVVRGMWYGSGRLETFTDERMNGADRRVDFHAWCPEPDGWLVIAVDPMLFAPAVLVRVHSVIQQ